MMYLPVDGLQHPVNSSRIRFQMYVLLSPKPGSWFMMWFMNAHINKFSVLLAIARDEAWLWFSLQQERLGFKAGVSECASCLSISKIYLQMWFLCREFWPFIHPSAHPPVCPSNHLSIHPIHLSVYPFIHPSIHLTKVYAATAKCWALWGSRDESSRWSWLSQSF